MTYTPPAFRATAFNCPFCNAFSAMHWSALYVQRNDSRAFSTIKAYASECVHCRNEAIWLSEPYPYLALGEPLDMRLIVPNYSTAPMPHPDMPEVVRRDYDEARRIASNSSRGAAALLRLAIQKLCVECGENGKSVNDDISSLVRKGLPIEIQQALDIVRVVGNNAVHPGELSSDDISDIATGLFELVNQIVEDRISRPKKLQAMFDKLPAGAREAIQKRDKK